MPCRRLRVQPTKAPRGSKAGIDRFYDAAVMVGVNIAVKKKFFSPPQEVSY